MRTSHCCWRSSSFILGAAVLVPWSARWQSLLTLASLVAFGIAAADGVVESTDLHRWLVLAAMGAFTLTFTALKDHYRSQTILIEALLDKEKRLAGSQAMLRTLFDAVPDIVTLTRFSDGKLIDTNEELLRRNGLSREKTLADFDGSSWRLGASGGARQVPLAIAERGPRPEFRNRFAVSWRGRALPRVIRDDSR